MPNYDGQELCGVEDTLGVGEMCKWPSPAILWGIQSNLPGFAGESFKAAIDLAWSFWTAVCGVRPQYVTSGTPNLIIGLQTLGPGQVLADCQLPCGASMSTSLQMRIDTAEAWVVAENPPNDKVDLVRVVCHELGHALGIPHIGSGNLMAPTYSTAIRKPKSGDIAEGVARYGLPAAQPPIPPPPTAPPADYEEIYALLSKGNKLFVRAKGVIAQLPS